MNNKSLQPHEIEQRLKNSAPFVMSADEKVSLKSALMNYADFHQGAPVKSAKPVTSPYTWWRLGSVMAVFLVCVTTTGAVAHNSLPGDSLYQFKLSVVEPLVLAVQNPELNHLSTQTELMERRLAEVQLLREDNALTPEMSKQVVEQLASYSDELSKEVLDPTAESLKTIDTAIAIMNAHNTLMGSTTGSTSPFTKLTDDLEDAQSEQMDTLLSQFDGETISDYIDDSVSDIQDRIANNRYASTTLHKVGDSIDDVADSLTLESLENAQEQIAEVNQLMLTEDYLKERE